MNRRSPRGEPHPARDLNEPRRECSRWPWVLAVAATGAPILPLWAIASIAVAVAEAVSRPLQASRPCLSTARSPSSTRSTRRRAQGPSFAALMVILRWIGGKADRASRKRGVAGLSGITLILVPTLFAVFPHWGENWRLLFKLIALAGWLLCGAIVVARTIRMEQRIDELSARQVAVEQRARTKTLNRSTDLLLSDFASRLPSGYHLQVFLPDPGRKRLIPVADPDGIGPEEGWRIDRDPPQAVTGAAWRTNDYVFAKGSAVSDATYGLTPEQQQRYERLTGVSATPIRDPRGNPIGVLTVCTEQADPKVSEREFVELLIALATELAPTLEDLGASVAPA